MPTQKNPLTKEVMQTLDSLWKLEKIILDTLDFNEVVKKVVDSILLELGYLDLGYKVVVLALLDDEKKHLRRVALSSTKEAIKTREVSEVPFEQIIIPVTATQNLCIKAVIDKKPQITHYFPDILTPPISESNAIESQKNAGIKTSMVFPLIVKGESIGVMIFSMDKSEVEVTDEERVLIQYFTDLVALAVQNARIYSDSEKKTESLRQANLKLKELDKIKDEFISITSHELKTPMSIIKSYLWMVTSGRGGPLTEKQEGYLEKAMNGSNRMINLINDMLNISRMQQGRLDFKFSSVSIPSLIEEMKDEIDLKAKEKGLKIILDLPEDLMSPYTDRDKLREIILNLMSNATKYTDEGTITIKGENVQEKFIKISVIDTGRGISKEESVILFKKFQRLDNSYKTMAKSGGTGLGLYIVKLYMANLGGSVGLESEGIGKGSTFWITLPVTEEQVHVSSITDKMNSDWEQPMSII